MNLNFAHISVRLKLLLLMKNISFVIFVVVLHFTDVMKDLGFTSEDIQNIYIKSSDENSSRHENKVTSMNENNNLGDRQTRKRLDDSDSDETVSSAWDEDATEKSESKVGKGYQTLHFIVIISF